MKGRLVSALWLLVGIDVAAMFLLIYLAFRGGQQARAASLGDLSQLNLSILLAVIVWLGASLWTWIMIANRVVAPVRSLQTFAERFAQGDYRARAAVESADDFGYIAEQLNRPGQRGGLGELHAG